MRISILSILVFIITICQLDGQSFSTITLSNDSIPIGGTIDINYTIVTSDPSQIKQLDYTVFDTLTPVIGMAGEGVEAPQADVDWAHSFVSDRTLDINNSDWKKTSRGYEFTDTISGTFWDFGLYSIGHPSVEKDSFTNLNIRKTQAAMLIVYGPQDIIKEDTTSAILPIKSIIAEPRTFEDYIWILYLLGGILLLAGLIYYLIKRNNTTPQIRERVIIKRPAHVIALEKLDKLRQAAYWKNDEEKRHHTEFTYIIREYLENRFNINALESTTDEISRALKQKDFSISHENNLREMLQISDLVKFAKATPPEDINEEFLSRAVDFVNDTLDPTSVDEEIIIKENSDDVG